jgi:outer membrane protein assembly factor BamE (lipoprotein component of BamABCDE complex)
MTMKNKLKTLIFAAAALASLSGCTLWEEEQIERIPLPGTEIPLDPEPWEPQGTDEKPVEG